jgi:hypothetical protein
MKIKYFKDTDTLYIELRRDAVVETKDLDENTQIDLDRARGTFARSRSSTRKDGRIFLTSHSKRSVPSMRRLLRPTVSP